MEPGAIFFFRGRRLEAGTPLQHREELPVHHSSTTISQPRSPESKPATVGPDPAGIATMRNQIDALDTAITRLVAERAQLSRRIQTARINAGGTRVELGRERAILSHYRGKLGSEGAALADAVLRVCRGSR
jgi:monofunctional chorismate mutase